MLNLSDLRRDGIPVARDKKKNVKNIYLKYELRESYSVFASNSKT